MNAEGPVVAGEINIVTVALDDHMVYPFCVLAHSIKSTAQTRFALVVGFFPGKLSASNQRLIDTILSSLAIKHELKELAPNILFTERRHLTMTTFSKFVLSDALAGPHLWLDIDTIVRPGWDDIFREIASAPRGTPLVVAEMTSGAQTRFSGFNAGVLGWTSAPRADWEPVLASLPEKRFSSEQHLLNSLYGAAVHQISSSYNFLSSWHKNKEELSHATIVHFSGPVKPWHLPRRHRQSWSHVNPSWEHWFIAEDALIESLTHADIRQLAQHAARRALLSGRLHTGKGALAGWVMRGITLLGPLSGPVIHFIVRRAT